MFHKSFWHLLGTLDACPGLRTAQVPNKHLVNVSSCCVGRVDNTQQPGGAGTINLPISQVGKDEAQRVK